MNFDKNIGKTGTVSNSFHIVDMNIVELSPQSNISHSYMKDLIKITKKLVMKAFGKKRIIINDMSYDTLCDKSILLADLLNGFVQNHINDKNRQLAIELAIEYYYACQMDKFIIEFLSMYNKFVNDNIVRKHKYIKTEYGCKTAWIEYHDNLKIIVINENNDNFAFRQGIWVYILQEENGIYRLYIRRYYSKNHLKRLRKNNFVFDYTDSIKSEYYIVNYVKTIDYRNKVNDALVHYKNIDIALSLFKTLEHGIYKNWS